MGTQLQYCKEFVKVGMKRITYDENYSKTVSYNKKGNGR